MSLAYLVVLRPLAHSRLDSAYRERTGQIVSAAVPIVFISGNPSTSQTLWQGQSCVSALAELCGTAFFHGYEVDPAGICLAMAGMRALVSYLPHGKLMNTSAGTMLWTRLCGVPVIRL
jgi:hypothetical protein